MSIYKLLTNSPSPRAPGVFLLLILFAFNAPGLWAAGKSDKIETANAEGGEIWEHDFDVSARKKGLYNFIVSARDRAGNESVSGPFNVRVDPHAGLPTVRVIYPDKNAIIRQSINLLGVASGRYGISRVVTRLDQGEYVDAAGTEYWNEYIDFSSVPDGRHTLYVQAIDGKGAAGPVEEVHFTLDTTPPSIKLISHTVGEIISGAIILTGEAGDPNGIRSMEYSEDGISFSAMPGARHHHTGFAFAMPVNTKKLPDGPLVFYLKAVDNTGIATVKPCLFFVSNAGPELELYTPLEGEDVHGAFFLSGRAFHTLGIAQLHYEWGRERGDIEIRPGDPYWHIALAAGRHSAKRIKITAVDRAGGAKSVTRKLEDKRKIKLPVLVIDYPSQDSLRMMKNGAPADTAIYGHIEPGSDPHSVLLNGHREVEALPAFRIPPEMIPHGRVAHTLTLAPHAANGDKGKALSFRLLKHSAMEKEESPVKVSSPLKNSWQGGKSFLLEGEVGEPEDAALEYRLGPQDAWQPLGLDEEGAFRLEVSMDGRPQGPVHLELRTIRGGDDDYPLYHPINWSTAQPDIRFISPPAEYATVWGNKTVMGSIAHSLPVKDVSYTVDMRHFTEIPFVAGEGKAWFSHFCDFDALRHSHGRLAFRITDATGESYYEIPEYAVDPQPRLPELILNSPVDQDVQTDAFEISGIAFDEVGISAIYWRILGPQPHSIAEGPAGAEARRRAEIYAENPDLPFQELKTDQSFSIPVDFEMITDGEYTLEVYASNPYGARSETVSRTVKVSTSPPETRILSPPITRYNRKAVMAQGYSMDANGIESVFLSMDSGNTWQNVVVHSDGRWELAINTVAYVDGIYSALIRTVDKYGIESLSNAMVNIDNAEPELHLASPLDGAHVGTELRLMGRVSDMTLKSLAFQIISAENPEFRRTVEAEPKQVIFDVLSLAGFPQGEYIIRVVATDLADNEAIISRKVVYDADDFGAEIAIYNPLPGEMHSGPVSVVGTVAGAFHPEEVQLLINHRPLGAAKLDRYGVFRYEVPEEMLADGEKYTLSAYYRSETGRRVSSPDHTIFYAAYGPMLLIESHQDGDVVTGRPWLSGFAWVSVPGPAEGEPALSRRELAVQRAENSALRIMVSHDNGRTFAAAKGGGGEWRARLETSLLPAGPQPVLVKAEFANGMEAVRRVMLYVDAAPPQVETVSPPERSVHRDNIPVFGNASDNYELADVEVSLRPYDKFWYSVPGPLRGLYFDVKGFGATYFDVGLGLSFFGDNVRFQGQFGITPSDGVSTAFAIGGRYVGQAWGIKLLANIFYLPFDYLFGLDWGFYSMNLAVGANFSYFLMDQYRTPLFIGAVVAQWDIANINFQFFNPKWKYFRNYALYLEPELWFASSDVNAETIFRMTVGMRINWF